MKNRIFLFTLLVFYNGFISVSQKIIKCEYKIKIIFKAINEQLATLVDS